MEIGEGTAPQTFSEVVHDRSKELFESEAKSGVISETPVEYQGQQYLLSYSITEAQQRQPLRFRVSIFDANNEETSAGQRNTPPRNVQLTSHELSTREFSIEDEGDRARIESESVTRAGYEGRQFGTALGLLSDILIEDIITRRPEQFYDKDIYAYIVDDARPAGTEERNSREGWSSSLARQLGYQKTSDYKGKPQYVKEYF